MASTSPRRSGTRRPRPRRSFPLRLPRLRLRRRWPTQAAVKPPRHGATGSHLLMREPSVAVRETAAEYLEERQTDWAFSKPIIVLDVLWNLVFVAITAAVLAASLDESPSVPLHAWLAGYVIQCLLHVLCVTVEYRRDQVVTARGGLD